MSEQTKTPETDAEASDGWSGDAICVSAKLARKLERERDEARKAGGFCPKHAPNGGARNCLVCACENLTFALSKISYLCGEENEMRQSEYDTHFNEVEVVHQVEKLKAQRDEAIRLERERNHTANVFMYQVKKLHAEHDQLLKVCDDLAHQIRVYGNSGITWFMVKNALASYDDLPHVKAKQK